MHSEVQCGQCERKFSGYSSLSRHVKEKHTKSRPAITATTAPTEAGARLITNLVKCIQASLASSGGRTTSPDQPSTILIETGPPSLTRELLPLIGEQPGEPGEQEQSLAPRNDPPAAAPQSPQKRRRVGGDSWSGWDQGSQQSAGYHFEHQAIWSEFSTQTHTEHNSFGTQTLLCAEDPFSLSDSDFVEYLDGEVQTERVDSACFASQTGDHAIGATSDRDCQTNWFTNSAQTQTKVRRERLENGNWLDMETQTARPEPPLCSETQTIDFGC